LYTPARDPLRARVSHRSRQKFREDRAIVKTDYRHVCVLQVPSPINYIIALRNPKKKIKKGHHTVYNTCIHTFVYYLTQCSNIYYTIQLLVKLTPTASCSPKQFNIIIYYAWAHIMFNIYKLFWLGVPRSIRSNVEMLRVTSVRIGRCF